MRKGWHAPALHVIGGLLGKDGQPQIGFRFFLPGLATPQDRIFPIEHPHQPALHLADTPRRERRSTLGPPG